MAIRRRYNNDIEFVFNDQGIEYLLESEHGPMAQFILERIIVGERVAKRYCPVDTGRLRNSIYYALAYDSEGIYGIIGTNVHYARFVEYGTRFMEAQPFLRPGLQAAMDF